MFDHLVQRGEAASQILSLRQGSSSVADYSIQFCILAAGTMHSPRDSQKELKDELATQEEYGDLEMLINLAFWLEN